MNSALRAQWKAAGFHIINHIINHIVYHTSLDTAELVPAEGMQRSVRAFASIIDHVNAMTIPQLRGPGFPPKDGRGTVLGPIGM